MEVITAARVRQEVWSYVAAGNNLQKHMVAIECNAGNLATPTRGFPGWSRFIGNPIIDINKPCIGVSFLLICGEGELDDAISSNVAFCKPSVVYL